MALSALKKKLTQSALINRLAPFAASDEFFIGRPRLAHLTANYRTWRDWRGLDRERLNYVALFGLPRGGTNLICARMHYHPQIFAVSERVHSRATMGARFFLLRSIYGYLGLQNKRIRDLRWVIFNKLHLDDPQWSPELARDRRFKFMVYLRNPLRVMVSMDRFAKKRGRPEWEYTPENFRALVSEAAGQLRIFWRAREISADSVLLMIHERFCLDAQDELQRALKFLDAGLDSSQITDNARSFFKRMYCCGAPAREDQGWIACPRCGRRVQGYGGYNPLEGVSRERTMGEAIGSHFRAEDLALFRERFGPELSRYWLEDNSHKYQEDVTRERLELFRIA